MDLERFKKLPILGILRGIEKDSLEGLVEAVCSAGLESIEITMNTDQAGDLIGCLNKLSKGRLMVGAGTVLTIDDCKKALDAGATFIVSPSLVLPLVEYCKKLDIPVFPGALTPHEIFNAHTAGATMVKVFPAKFFGPSYFREIKGPFSDIELLACGGVDDRNINDFFSSGASAIAFGGSIFRKEYLEKKNFPAIESSVKNLIEAYQKINRFK